MKYLKKININAWTVSAITSIVFVIIVTIASELFQPIKNWLTETFSHHWVGKGVISIVIFIALGFLLNIVMKNDDKKTNSSLYFLFWITSFGMLAIIGFYIYETFFISH